MVLSIVKPGAPRCTYILAGDIGATKTNLAIYHWEDMKLSVQKQQHYKTRSFKDISSMISVFLSDAELPERICLAVAGPVQEGKANLTNIGWELNGTDISASFHQIPVLLINDLQATACGLAVIDDKDTCVLHKGKKDPKGNAAIIAPGTGLGEAGLFYNEGSYHPFASEGGHCDFAPRADIDIELYHFLKNKYEHVSWERLISGPGICTIFDFLHEVKKMEEPDWLKNNIQASDKASVISGCVEKCEICKETIDLFLRYLAVESANLALKFKSTGGLFIAGGIIPHLQPYIGEDFFGKWFCQAGRLKDLLQSVPVAIILNEHAPVLGAAYYGVHAR